MPGSSSAPRAVVWMCSEAALCNNHVSGVSLHYPLSMARPGSATKLSGSNRPGEHIPGHPLGEQEAASTGSVPTWVRNEGNPTATEKPFYFTPGYSSALSLSDSRSNAAPCFQWKYWHHIRHRKRRHAKRRDNTTHIASVRARHTHSAAAHLVLTSQWWVRVMSLGSQTLRRKFLYTSSLSSHHT